MELIEPANSIVVLEQGGPRHYMPVSTIEPDSPDRETLLDTLAFKITPGCWRVRVQSKAKNSPSFAWRATGETFTGKEVFGPACPHCGRTPVDPSVPILQRTIEAVSTQFVNLHKAATTGLGSVLREAGTVLVLQREFSQRPVVPEHEESESTARAQAYDKFTGVLNMMVDTQVSKRFGGGVRGEVLKIFGDARFRTLANLDDGIAALYLANDDAASITCIQQIMQDPMKLRNILSADEWTKVQELIKKLNEAKK